MSRRIMYKIVDYERGVIKTLFHGVNRSRVLEPYEWIKAEKKMVSDGSSSTKYLSGFHVLESPGECYKYLETFKNIDKKAVVPCEVKGEIRPKSHSRYPIFLADEIKLVLPIMPYRRDKK